jgi:PEP-CTERM putative exosortase interaction domain
MTCCRLAMLLVSLLVLAPCAQADPITPASFTATIAGNRPGGEILFRIEMPSTLLRLETDRSEEPAGNLSHNLLPCADCGPGEFDFTGTISTTTSLNSRLNGTDTVVFTSSFQVVSPRAVMAPAVHGISETTVPIRVSGEISYRVLRRGPPGGPPVVADPPIILHLAGEGHGVLRRDEPLQFFPAITLSFASDAAPTPEPATILLFGIGTAIVGRRAWKSAGH